MNKRKHCKRCKSIYNLPDKPYSTYVKKDGTVMGSYICRPCNAELGRNYRKTERGKTVYRNIVRRQYERNRIKVLARGAVKDALKSGKLVKPTVCSNCGISCIPEGHHENYTKPIEVIWLCKKCHDNVTHKGIGEGNNGR